MMSHYKKNMSEPDPIRFCGEQTGVRKLMKEQNVLLRPAFHKHVDHIELLG